MKSALAFSWLTMLVLWELTRESADLAHADAVEPG